MIIDEMVHLIERYGYARRNGIHQDKTSAEWMAYIRKGLEIMDSIPHEMMAEYTRTGRLIGWGDYTDSPKPWSIIEEIEVAFGRGD